MTRKTTQREKVEHVPSQRQTRSPQRTAAIWIASPSERVRKLKRKAGASTHPRETSRRSLWHPLCAHLRTNEVEGNVSERRAATGVEIGPAPAEASRTGDADVP